MLVWTEIVLAGFIFEPYMGNHRKTASSHFTFDNKAGGGFNHWTGRSDPFFYGTRIGYQTFLNIMFGLEWTGEYLRRYEFKLRPEHTFTFNNNPTDTFWIKPFVMHYGIWVGIELPIRIRYWASYYPYTRWKAMGRYVPQVITDRDVLEGSSYAMGLGFLLHENISINVEKRVSNFPDGQRPNGVGYTYRYDLREKSYGVSISFPLRSK